MNLQLKRNNFANVCVCVCAKHQESSSLRLVGNRSMRYDGHVREMPSAGQLILGTTPRDHFLLELGLLDLRPVARFLTLARAAPIPPIRSGLLFKPFRFGRSMNTARNDFCSRNVNDRSTETFEKFRGPKLCSRFIVQLATK